MAYNMYQICNCGDWNVSNQFRWKNTTVLEYYSGIKFTIYMYIKSGYLVNIVTFSLIKGDKMWK